MNKLLILLITLLPVGGLAEQVQHPPGRFVTVMNKKLWVEIEGHGEPLLLIPGGGGGSHDYFHPFLDALSSKFKVIYFDGFGRGKSEHAKAVTEYSFDRDIEEVEALRKALGLGKINLLGHSYGGFVAQQYAIKYPQSVKRLVLANTLASGRDYQASNDFVNQTLEQYFPETWEKISALRAKGLVANSPELQQAYSEIFDSMVAQFYFYDPSNVSKLAPFNEHNFNADQYYAIVGQDADFNIGEPLASWYPSSHLSDLKVPIMVLAGRADGVVFPRLARRLAAAMPKARFVVFEKSGHFPFIEENKRFLAVVAEFLEK